MAQKVIRVLVDDLDGSDAQETVTFSMDGILYEVDLSSANAANFRHALAPYVKAGRKLARRNRQVGPSKRKGTRKPSDISEIREWARLNGYNPSPRGRISSHIRAAYERAAA
jgi:hypothetical protein